MEPGRSELRRLSDSNAGDERLIAVEVGEACIFGFEADGLLLIEPLAKQVQTIAGKGDIVRWKREQQALQTAMDIGNPIRDLSPRYGGGFLQRERDLLIKEGWKFDRGTGYWKP